MHVGIHPVIPLFVFFPYKGKGPSNISPLLGRSASAMSVQELGFCAQKSHRGLRESYFIF